MFIARPTSGGVIFLLLTLAAAGVAVMNVGLMTALCASALAGMWLSSFLIAQFSVGKLRVERLTAADVPGNSTAVLPLRIVNASHFYRQVMVVREKLDFSLQKVCRTAVPAMAPGETVILNREINADRRGRYKLDKLTIISGDPCGFFKRTRTFHLPGEITVTPRIEELENLPVSRRDRPSDGGEGRLLGHAGIGGDFFGIRPYRPGDEIQHIYWRGSAARNKLMVKEFEASVTEKIHIVLDTCAADVGQDGTDNNFEHLVSCAASVADTLGKRYCHLTFAAEFPDGERVRISGDSAGVRIKIIEALTEIRCSPVSVENLLCDTVEHLNPGDTLFLLTMSCPPVLSDLVKQLRESGIRVNWIHAPARNFPPVEPDIIRELPPPLPEEPGDGDRIVIDFKTSLSEILYYDDALEKV